MRKNKARDHAILESVIKQNDMRSISDLFDKKIKPGTFTEVGKEYGVTRERARQVFNKEKRKVKSMDINCRGDGEWK